jgi:two-component system chemotaxis response regulator CheY
MMTMQRGCDMENEKPIEKKAVEKKLTAVIVDDTDIIRTVLRLMLRSNNFDVIGEASDGEHGLELVLRLRPDIVFLDVKMPKVSGLEVLKKVKEKLPKQIALMVTGNNDINTVQEALQSGADGFIIKPFNAGTVIKTIERAIAKANEA